MTLKYRQGHWHSYHLKAVVWFLISNFSSYGRIVYNFWDIGRGNDNMKWPSNAIQGHRIIPIESSHVSCYQWSIVTFDVSLTVSKIQAVLMLKPTFLTTHLYLTLNLNVMPLECGDKIFGTRKLESWGCHTVKKSWSQVKPCGHSLRVWQTDGRTDLRWLKSRCA